MLPVISLSSSSTTGILHYSQCGTERNRARNPAPLSCINVFLPGLKALARCVVRWSEHGWKAVWQGAPAPQGQDSHPHPWPMLCLRAIASQPSGSAWSITPHTSAHILGKMQGSPWLKLFVRIGSPETVQECSHFSVFSIIIAVQVPDFFISANLTSHPQEYIIQKV